MGNKATQPRSFNTIRRSQTKVRAKRRQTQRVELCDAVRALWFDYDEWC